MTLAHIALALLAYVTVAALTYALVWPLLRAGARADEAVHTSGAACADGVQHGSTGTSSPTT